MHSQFVKDQGKIEVHFGEILMSLNRRRKMFPGDRPPLQLVLGDSFCVLLSSGGIAVRWRSQWHARRYRCASTMQDGEAHGDSSCNESHGGNLNADRYFFQL
jgi:hypothetical protein